VVEKIREELDEVLVEMTSGNKTELEKEIGDLLFAVINLARHEGINPDTALRGTNIRFSERFAIVEQEAETAGGWQALSSGDMEAAWQRAKRTLKSKDI